MGLGWDDVKTGFNTAFNPFSDDHWTRRAGIVKGDQRPTSQFGQVDQGGNIAREAGGASRFGQSGERAFRQLGNESAAVRGRLGRLASGQDSISAEQLRQGLQQNIAGQSAMAASARPANAAMMARTASQNAMRAGSGLAGQQALAGIAERQAANQALGQMLMQQREQELRASLGGRELGLRGYGMNEDARTSRYAADMGVGRGDDANDKTMQMLQQGALMYAMSDRRLKSGIADGEAEADKLLKGLKAYTYRYNDEKHGKGERVGIMAQDLERTKAGRQAVIETPEGKAIHGAHLAAALAATLPGIDKRIARLEGKKK